MPELVGPSYLRHEPQGTRTVTPQQYAAEIVAARKALGLEERGGEGFSFKLMAEDDLVFYVYEVESPAGAIGKGRSVYRLENGKLVETWVQSVPPAPPQPEAAG